MIGWDRPTVAAKITANWRVIDSRKAKNEILIECSLD
jgi:hypothetical protein